MLSNSGLSYLSSFSFVWIFSYCLMLLFLRPPAEVLQVSSRIFYFDDRLLSMLSLLVNKLLYFRTLPVSICEDYPTILR